MLQVLEVSGWGMKAVYRINIIPDVPTEHLGRSQPRRMSASQHLRLYMFGLKVPQLTFRVNHLFSGSQYIGIIKQWPMINSPKRENAPVDECQPFQTNPTTRSRS